MSQKNYSLMIAILCWSGMVIMSSLYVTIPLASLFADIFGVTLTQAAAAGSSFSVAFAACCLFYGPLSEKYGRKRVIVIGLIALTFISLSLGMVNQFVWILVLRGLQGAAAATFSSVALAYAVEMFPASKKVTAIGFISTGFLLAGIVGQVISSLISQQYSWSNVFYTLGVIYAVTLLLVITLLPKEERQVVHTNVWAPFKQMPLLFTQKNMVLSYVIALILLMSFVSMYTVLGSYLAGPAFGLGPNEMLHIRIFGAAGMLVSPLAGKLAQNLGVRSLLFGGLGLALAGLVSLSLVASVPLLTGASILFVAGIALASPPLISLIGELGGKSRGSAVSVYTFILFLGTSLGPILSIRLMSFVGCPVTFALLAVLPGIGMLALRFIHKNKEATAAV